MIPRYAALRTPAAREAVTELVDDAEYIALADAGIPVIRVDVLVWCPGAGRRQVATLGDVEEIVCVTADDPRAAVIDRDLLCWYNNGSDSEPIEQVLLDEMRRWRGQSVYWIVFDVPAATGHDELEPQNSQYCGFVHES